MYEAALKPNGVNKKILGGFLIILGLAIGLSVAYKNSNKSQQPIIYSTTYTLNALWASYKNHYIDQSGRTFDPQREGLTTSEGQSYTMLRAVWQDDKEIFDRSWQWTVNNLKRSQDNLFAWAYGKKADGSFGILTERGGQNTASDADSDIALALIFASARWNEEAYLTEAKKIINDIWDHEVVTVKGIPYMTADNLEQNSKTSVIINPSYLSPATYKIFAEVDTGHDWQAVVHSSYRLINDSTAANFPNQVSVGLPPDWMALNLTSGKLEPSAKGSLDTNYGFDALRVPFRLALDYQWNQDLRAKEVLDKFKFLSQQWQGKKLLYATYGHDGSTVFNFEAPAMYGGSLGYFLVSDKPAAEEIYENKLLNLYNPDFQDFKQQLSYYDSNWAWFGIALYNNKLVNLYETKSNAFNF